MALVLADRIKETTSTTGTGTYTLAGAENGFEAFSVIGNSNTTYYCCTDGVDFEIGLGTYTLSGTTLARTTVLQSSNDDDEVVWTNGLRTIFCTQPAEKAVFLDATGNMPITNSASVGGSLTVTGDGTFGGTIGVTGVLTGTSLDISGNIDVDGITNLDVVDIDGAVDMASTLAVAGVVTANAGVVVDNITIDGTQIDLSSGDLTIDVAGDIILDAAGNEIKFQDNGTLIGFITLDNTDLTIQSSAQDRDIIFKGDDGGSGIEAMRIDMSAGGNLCVGAAASIGAGKLEATFNGSSFNGIVLKTTRSATGTNFIEFTNAAGDNAGRINHDGTTTVAFTTSSDYRLKENVSYSWDATTRLKQLKPARFNFISQADKTVDGFLAHEVSNIVPAAIIGTKDEIKKWNADEIEDGLAPDGASDGDNKLDADGNAIPLMQGIDQSKLVPLLVKTIQELEARITALENA